MLLGLRGVPKQKGFPDIIEIQKQYNKDESNFRLFIDTNCRRVIVLFITTYGIDYPVTFLTPYFVRTDGGTESIPTSVKYQKLEIYF